MSKVDAVCAAAVDLARTAAEDDAAEPAQVGPHVSVTEAGERVAVHRFRCDDPAYRGWLWEVQVSRVARARTATVDDVVLLPGEGALLPPEWVPWSQRLRPGDLGVGDLLPTAADDPRLVLRVADTEGWVDTDAWLELGLGRPRVLSADGRSDSAERWHDGEAGPQAALARSAPAGCASCGFYVHLAGALGLLFGVCANELAPDDGRVVAADHGCGAHSEALVLPSARPQPVSFDDAELDLTDPSGHAPGSVDSREASEPYGHS